MKTQTNLAKLVRQTLSVQPTCESWRQSNASCYTAATRTQLFTKTKLKCQEFPTASYQTKLNISLGKIWQYYGSSKIWLSIPGLQKPSLLLSLPSNVKLYLLIYFFSVSVSKQLRIYTPRRNITAWTLSVWSLLSFSFWLSVCFYQLHRKLSRSLAAKFSMMFSD